jgi:hypothetical protein
MECGLVEIAQVRPAKSRGARQPRDRSAFNERRRRDRRDAGADHDDAEFIATRRSGFCERPGVPAPIRASPFYATAKLSRINCPRHFLGLAL